MKNVDDSDILLPVDNRTSFEVAHDATDAARMPLSVSIVRDMADAKKIPIEFLPALAWSRGTDLWFDDWHEDRKRDVVEQSFILHRLKGTVEGARRYLSLVDAHLLNYLTPSVRAFAMPGITAAQRNEWLSRMPQIRVYYHNSVGSAKGLSFFGDANRLFASADRGWELYGRRAVLRSPDGSETPLRHVTVERAVEERAALQVDCVIVNGNAGRAPFVGRMACRAYFGSERSPARLYTYRLDRTYDYKSSTLHLDTLVPTMEPISVNYAQESDIGEAGASQFVSMPARKFASPDRAPWLLSDRIYLHDKTADVPWSRGHSFTNHARIAVNRFTAEFQADVTRPAHRQAAFIGKPYINRSFATSEDITAARRAYEALRLSKPARDRYFIDTQTRRRATFGDRIIMDGSFRFGQQVRKTL